MADPTCPECGHDYPHDIFDECPKNETVLAWQASHPLRTPPPKRTRTLHDVLVFLWYVTAALGLAVLARCPS